MARVALVTGGMGGLGESICIKLAALGYKVVTTHSPGNEKAAEWLQTMNNMGYGFKAYPCDVADFDSCKACVEQVIKEVGPVDVLVNNAGIGYFSAIEEGDEATIRRLFDINVFGLAAMTRAVLPGMRRQKHGCIVNLSSIAGLRGAPSLGYYNASKFAVEGLSEALWQEVEPLGIKVMLVEPSGFRTDFAGRSAAESAERIGDYAQTAGARRDKVRGSSGKQAGDPVRLVRIVIDAVASGHPPHRMPLGNVAIDGALEKIEQLRAEFLAGEARARAADAPPA